MVFESIGLIAGCLTTISMFPQIYKIIKTKSANDVSKIYFIIFMIGLILWIIYGLHLKSTPIVLFNIITFMEGLCVLYLTFRYKK
jgi:MtN3 and saliva related transmembrane protein